MTQICTKCGEPMEDHKVTQRNARGHKCPIKRENKDTPPQEHRRSRSGEM